MKENTIEKLMKLCDYEKLDKHNVLLSYQNEGICFINKNGQDVECPVLGVAIDEGVWYVKITNNPDQWVSVKDIYIVEEGLLCHKNFIRYKEF